MRIHHRLEDVGSRGPSFVTVGMFDGVHLAHRAIIEQTVARAQAHQGRAIVVTFDPHPKEIIGDPSAVELLTTLDERTTLISALGVDILLVLPFDRDFSRIAFREFTQRFLVEGLGAVGVMEGYDHHWGRNREGDVDALKQLGEEFGFSVYASDPIRVGETLVNSSNLRSLLRDGSVAEAARLLGRPYSLTGTVVEGDKRGRTLGYPTANLALPTPRKLVPRNGIYVVRAFVENRTIGGLLSIGVRPTFGANGRRMIEVHLLDFQGDLYGETLRVEILHRIRDEQKFDSPEALVRQMTLDEAEGRRFINDSLITS